MKKSLSFAFACAMLQALLPAALAKTAPTASCWNSCMAGYHTEQYCKNKCGSAPICWGGCLPSHTFEYCAKSCGRGRTCEEKCVESLHTAPYCENACSTGSDAQPNERKNAIRGKPFSRGAREDRLIDPPQDNEREGTAAPAQ